MFELIVTVNSLQDFQKYGFTYLHRNTWLMELSHALVSHEDLFLPRMVYGHTLILVSTLLKATMKICYNIFCSWQCNLFAGWWQEYLYL